MGGGERNLERLTERGIMEDFPGLGREKRYLSPGSQRKVFTVDREGPTEYKLYSHWVKNRSTLLKPDIPDKKHSRKNDGRKSKTWEGEIWIVRAPGGTKPREASGLTPPCIKFRWGEA